MKPFSGRKHVSFGVFVLVLILLVVCAALLVLKWNRSPAKESSYPAVSVESPGRVEPPVVVEPVRPPEPASPPSFPADYWDVKAEGGYIRDEAGILDEETRSMVLHYIRLILERTGIHLGLAVIPSRGASGMVYLAQEYSRLLRDAGLPPAKTILWLVAVKESEVHVEIGSEAALVISQEQARAVLDAEFFHAWSQGNLLGAFWSTVARFFGILTGERPAPLTASDPPARRFASYIFPVLFVSIFIAVGFFVLGLSVASRQIFQIIWGALFGGIPLIGFNFALISTGIYWALILHVPVAILAARLGYRFGKRKKI